ncbi:MAG: biotin--[acetyl-CoA-carboxylase] ligase [Pseudomonadota bacterium]
MTIPLEAAARARFPEVCRFPLLDSTNEEVRRRIDAGTCRCGLVVLADRQTNGRGRLGRTWASPAGNLHISFARRLDEPSHLTTAMTLVAGQALAQAVEQASGLRPSIKWPNDLQLRGRKLAGILVEGHRGWQIIGAGVNVGIDLSELPEDLRSKATSLRLHLASPPEPSALAARYLEAFISHEAGLLRRGALNMELWSRYWGDRGRRVTAWLGQVPLEGVPEEVTALGVLRLRDDEGRLHDIRSGEILHLRHHSEYDEGRRDVPGD